MGKPTKRQGRKRYNYDINRRKQWAKRKKMPVIQCKEIAESWDRKKSVLKNLSDMGISADPNKTIRIKKTKESLGPKHTDDQMDVEEERPEKEHVIQSLEASASVPAAKTNKLSEPEAQYCVYMLDKYGDDYKAMSRDSKNYYQETPKQIKKKINMFKNTPEQYVAYLESKDDVCELWRSDCTSPVVRDDTEGHRLETHKHRRRVTRTYEAAHRNGHYNMSPELIGHDKGKVTPLVTISKVKRQLKFGRKPPRLRENT